MIHFLTAGLAAAALVFAQNDSPASSRIAEDTRPFHLGFTPWPADLSIEGMKTAHDFAMAHGDMVSVMFIGGIPWPEALEGRPFSKDVQKSLAMRFPGKKLFLSISPLDQVRSTVAPYWGEKDNLPLPQEWAERPLNSPEVKKAYRNFVLRAVEAMNPDYLAVGIELNAFLSKKPKEWPALKELYRETYRAVKEKHPRLLVFFTTEVNHYRKFAHEAKATDQEGEVAELMRESDLFAMSVYPHMSFAIPRPVPRDFFDFARRFGKPIAVSESGITSRDVELKSFGLTLRGSEEDQRQFVDLLLTTAARDRYRFVVNFATTDFEKLCEKLPSATADLARIWCYTGMQSSDKRPKPALAVWDRWLRAKHGGRQGPKGE